MKLKDLIMEKKSLEDRVEKMKAINTQLVMMKSVTWKCHVTIFSVLMTIIKIHLFANTAIPVFNDHPWDPKIKGVAEVVVQRYLYVIKVQNGTSKWWPL